MLAEVVVPSQVPTSCWTGGIVAIRSRPPKVVDPCAALGVLVGREVGVATMVVTGVAGAEDIA